MQLTAGEAALLKPHIISRLEKISEADNDVLADYVLELLKTNSSDEHEVARNAKEQLSEFLAGHEIQFVEELLGFVREGSWNPAVHELRKQESMAAKAAEQALKATTAVNGARGRKRGFDEDADTVVHGASGPSWRGRPIKAARRVGGRAQHGRGGWQQGQALKQLADFNFDPSNPFAALVAMQQALSAQLGQLPRSGNRERRGPGHGKRCRDFDNKGICLRGANCPYEHELDYDEYDSSDPTAVDGRDEAHREASQPSQGRGGNGFQRGGTARRGRTHFSSTRPDRDLGNTSIVVENIPPANLNMADVRSFFEQFGQIANVELRQDEALAILTYSDRESAQAAYGSPKVIFDNRFVKVFWFRTRHRTAHTAIGHSKIDNDQSGDTLMQDDTRYAFDVAEFERRQAAAQERFQDLKAARDKRVDIQRNIDAQEAERARLLTELTKRARAGVEAGNGINDTHANVNNDIVSSQTEALRAQLAALEDEARSMGIDPHDSPQAVSLSYSAVIGRGRGLHPRGRGVVGSWQGRGRGPGGRGGLAYHSTFDGGAVKRLDNRPRALAILFPKEQAFDETKDEALKQFLLFNDQIQAASIVQHPGRSDAAIIAFSERYRAEVILGAIQAANMDVPHVGKVEVAWVANSEVPDGASSLGRSGKNDTTTGAVDDEDALNDSVKGTWSAAASTQDGQDVAAAQEQRDRQGRDKSGRGSPHEADYDVADDDHRWTAE